MLGTVKWHQKQSYSEIKHLPAHQRSFITNKLRGFVGVCSPQPALKIRYT